jgi:hypothetical protein
MPMREFKLWGIATWNYMALRWINAADNTGRLKARVDAALSSSGTAT